MNDIEISIVRWATMVPRRMSPICDGVPAIVQLGDCRFTSSMPLGAGDAESINQQIRRLMGVRERKS